MSDFLPPGYDPGDLHPTTVVAWQRVLARLKLPSATHHVALTLATYADWQTGANARPGQGRLAIDVNRSTRTVRTHLELLERAGLVERTHKGYGNQHQRAADTYALRCPAHLAALPHVASYPNGTTRVGAHETVSPDLGNHEGPSADGASGSGLPVPDGASGSGLPVPDGASGSGLPVPDGRYRKSETPVAEICDAGSGSPLPPTYQGPNQLPATTSTSLTDRAREDRLALEARARARAAVASA